jgi:hypothetical protein
MTRYRAAAEQVKRLETYLGTRDPTVSATSVAAPEPKQRWKQQLEQQHRAEASIGRLATVNQLLRARLAALEQILTIQETTLTAHNGGAVTLNTIKQPHLQSSSSGDGSDGDKHATGSGWGGVGGRPASATPTEVRSEAGHTLLRRWRTKTFELMIQLASAEATQASHVAPKTF